MTHKLQALVGETCTTTGTGPLAMGGALTDHRRFNTVLSVGDTTEISVRHATDGTWATYKATYTATNELTLTTMEESSSGSAITWAAGSKTVVLTPLASRLYDIDKAVADIGAAIQFGGF